MTTTLTNRDIQRTTFVDSLHNSLRKQAIKAINDQKKFLVLATSYIEDGLEEQECVELLMIDGLPREASESYVSTVLGNKEEELFNNYSFQFEDGYGKVWSSYDIGKGVMASNDDEAWEKAELLMSTDEFIESNKILSVNRTS